MAGTSRCCPVFFSGFNWFQSIPRFPSYSTSNTAINQLQDSHPDNDATAIKRLGEIGPDASDTASEIVKFLDKKYEQVVRTEAAFALAEIQPDPDLVLPALIIALDDQDPDVRGLVASALANLGNPAIPEITKVLDEGQDYTNKKAAAMVALKEMVISSTNNLKNCR